MGEAAGLETSLRAATDKLSSLPSPGAATTAIADLGIPIIRSANRTATGADEPSQLASQQGVADGISSSSIVE